ncbi:MAG: hypothetical protein BGO32_04805 [Bacteroidetes bacterium 37-13]|nr:MAG: hypothetical protein BGO32_04805 [Bacteroidetes bacterium 37-13]
MRRLNLFLGLTLLYLLFSGCKKDKCQKQNECKGTPYEISPFIERYGSIFCGVNDYEYTYIFRKRAQIDSISKCTFSPSPAFPIDESNMAYIMFGKLSYHYKDTLITNLVIDTCSKLLTYEVNMIQRDTTVLCCPYGISVVRTIFCSVENIPADYQVEVKYKYVPLPE